MANTHRCGRVFGAARRLAERLGRLAPVPIIGAMVLASSVSAQTDPVPTPKLPPKGPPSFFVTSTPIGRGGDLGGLKGADQQCQSLAEAAGLGGRQWRAYLSTQATKDAPAVNARDRIGKGPWYNIQGMRVATGLSDLHGDTLESARNGPLISRSTALTEKGDPLPGDAQHRVFHDIMTGSTADGRAMPGKEDKTCRNWTYGGTDGGAQVGHADRDSVFSSLSWNSAHASPGCSVERMALSGGKGLLYCFAADPAPR